MSVSLKTDSVNYLNIGLMVLSVVLVLRYPLELLSSGRMKITEQYFQDGGR